MNNRILLREIRRLKKDNKRQSMFTLYWGSVTLIVSIALSFLAISFSLGGIRDINSTYIYYYAFWILLIGFIPAYTLIFFLNMNRKKK